MEIGQGSEWGMVPWRQPRPRRRVRPTQGSPCQRIIVVHQDFHLDGEGELICSSGAFDSNAYVC